LGAACKYGIKVKLLTTNPVADATPPRVERASFDCWTIDESRAFLGAVAAYHDHWRQAEPDRYLIPAVLWDLLLREGMRRGEALGLRWKDITWQRGTAHISQSVIADATRNGAALIQPRTKTRAGARTVRLTAETLAALEAWRKQWAALKLAAEEWRDTDLIVCARHGGPVTPRNVDRALAAICAPAGVRKITTHQLRHTSATLMFLVGISPKIVAEKLGHASVALTLSVYSHVLPDMQDDAATAMSRILA